MNARLARIALVVLAVTVAATVADTNASVAKWAHDRLLAYAVGQCPEYQVGRHTAFLAAHLEAVERGEIKRLIVNEPPRHGKSMQTSELFPAWCMGRKPTRKIIGASYAQELASDFGRKVRDHSATDLHLAAFPGSDLSPDSKAAHRFNTRLGGAYFAVGRGGSATGRGADLILADDTLKDRKEAESATIRKHLHEWYRSVLRTRLMPGGAIVIVNTRWHDDDLAGYVLREHAHENWKVLNLPAMAEADDPLGRAPGEALWPEFYPLAELESLKATLGTYDWSALYQGRPIPREGGVFKLGWFDTRYDARAKDEIRIVQSWDTAMKAEDTNDPSVCTTWAETPRDYYLLHVHRERMEWPQLRRTALRLAEEFKPHALLIEDKSSGTSLVQDLRANTSLPLIAVDPEGDKQLRAMSVAPIAEAGKVRLPNAAPWLDPYLHELTTFPGSANDDQVDSTSQALKWMSRSAAPRIAVSTTQPAEVYRESIMGMDS